jgi:hypothetical protein
VGVGRRGKVEAIPDKTRLLACLFCQATRENACEGSALFFSDESGQALSAHNKPNTPGGFASFNYVVEVKHILWTKAMIDGFFVQKISAHLRFNHF